MELMQLRYFKEVARQENFTRAAKTLHITQSALSKSIAKLEEEVGVRLFERNGNRVHLNRLGKALLDCSDQTLRDLENSLGQVRRMAGLEAGTVRVGVSPDVFIKHLAKEFLLARPDASLICLLQSEAQMAAGLYEGTIDFTVTTDPVPGNDLVWRPLYEDHLTVLLSDRHPLAGRRVLFLEELANERFIITNLGEGMRSSTYDLCRMAGFEPKVIYEGYDTEMTTALVDRNLAVQITPHSISVGVSRFQEGRPPAPIAAIPVANDFTNKTLGIMTKRGHYQSAAALEFYDRIVEYFSALD